MIVYIICTVCFLIILSLNIFAGARQDTKTKTFEDFDFDEYMMLISEIAETVEYPHFLEQNSHRYTVYRENNPDIPFDVVIAHVNVNIDLEPYTGVQSIEDPYKITVLVNKYFSLEADWEPGDFVDIGGGHLMREEAAQYFKEMREAMREENLNLNIIITYRSYRSQRNHFSNAVARSGRASAEAGFARAGHSEHQTGLAIDVLHKAHDGGLMMNMGFEQSRQFNWMVENAHEYGFILRFPRGYRDYSKFIFEPWHWRYVGADIATAMYNEEIALFEEFYGRYLVQGVIDNVNAYIAEQKALEEAATTAAIAEAEEAAAAELAAMAEAEAAAKEAAELAALMEVIRKAAEEKKEIIEPAENETPSGGRHFIEGIASIGIIIIVLIVHVARKRN